MHKFVAVVCQAFFLISVVFVCTKIGLYKHALNKQKQERNNNHKVTSEVYDRLNELTDIPIIGYQFQEPKVEELLKLQRFEESLKIAAQLVQSSFNQRSFRLWLSKAKAQIQLKLYQQCEESLSKASAFSRTRLDDYRIEILMDEINDYRAFEKLRALGEVKKVQKRLKKVNYQRQLLNLQNQNL